MPRKKLVSYAGAERPPIIIETPIVLSQTVGVKTLVDLADNECHSIMANGLYCGEPVPPNSKARKAYCASCYERMHTSAPKVNSSLPAHHTYKSLMFKRDI